MSKGNFKLTDELVLQLKIDALRKSPAQLARDYKVSVKTVGRILSGESWAHIQINPLLSVQILSHPTALHRSEISDLKMKFALSPDLPIHYGIYEHEDGLHHIATDGLIAWESKSIHDAAKQYQSLDSAGFPYFSDKVCELSTFELYDLFNLPLGKILKADIQDFESNVRLRSRAGHVYEVPQKYWWLVKNLGLHFYENLKNPDVLFIVKLTAFYEVEAGIHACVRAKQIHELSPTPVLETAAA